MNELKIRTDLLKNEGFIEKIIDPYCCAALDGLAKQQQLKAHYEATDLDNELLLRGTVTGTVTFNCGRCLEDFVHPVDIAFTQSFEAKIPEIDVEEELSEAVVLSIPLHPVCADACKGLCPHCGVNRNTTTCACDENHRTDPRWDKLKDILKK
jgi:uncharacterized protein